MPLGATYKCFYLLTYLFCVFNTDR